MIRVKLGFYVQTRKIFQLCFFILETVVLLTPQNHAQNPSFFGRFMFINSFINQGEVNVWVGTALDWTFSNLPFVVVGSRCQRQQEAEKVIRIQVKTIDWPKDKRRTVTLSNEMRFDYLVVILLDLTQIHSRYLIISKLEIDALASTENPTRGNKSRSWYLAKDFAATDRIGIHENKWEKIL